MPGAVRKPKRSAAAWRARVTVLARGPERIGPGFTVRLELSGFREDVVDRLKCIPESSRRYDPETKQWYFKPAFFERVCEIAGRCSVATLTRGFGRRDIHTGEWF